MSISKDQARKLAEQFRLASVAVGDYRFAHWGQLSPAERQQLSDEEWTLLNDSNDMVTKAVDLALADVEKDLEVIIAATERAAGVLKSIQAFKDAVTVVAGLVGLAGAIAAAVVSENPGPVLAAAVDLVGTLKEVGSRGAG